MTLSDRFQFDLPNFAVGQRPSIEFAKLSQLILDLDLKAALRTELGTLNGGAITLITEVGDPGVDDKVPSEQAVREALDLVVSGSGAVADEDLACFNAANNSIKTVGITKTELEAIETQSHAAADDDNFDTLTASTDAPDGDVDVILIKTAAGYRKISLDNLFQTRMPINLDAVAALQVNTGGASLVNTKASPRTVPVIRFTGALDGGNKQKTYAHFRIPAMPGNYDGGALRFRAIFTFTCTTATNTIPTWSAGQWTQGYAIGGARSATSNYCIPIVPNGYVYRCSTTGTEPDSEPNWPTVPDQTVGTGARAVWTCVKMGFRIGIQALAISDGESLARSWDDATPTEMTIQSNARIGYNNISVLSGDVVVGGTPGPGKTVYIQIYRDGLDVEDNTRANLDLIGLSGDYGVNAFSC